MFRKITYCLIVLLIFVSGCSNNVQMQDIKKTIWKIKINPAISWIDQHINVCLNDYPQIQALNIQGADDTIDDSDLDFIISFKDDDLIYEQSYILGYDHIAFIVNPINPVNKLSEEQIIDIFQGNLKEWSMLTTDIHSRK